MNNDNKYKNITHNSREFHILTYSNGSMYNENNVKVITEISRAFYILQLC